jgi:hypothetical protein
MGGGSCDVEWVSCGTVALSGSGDDDTDSGVRASSKGSIFGITFSLSGFDVVMSLVAMEPIPKSDSKAKLTRRTWHKRKTRPLQ